MSRFRKKLCDNAGFTLIELLVVIAVLGILAGIAIPRLGGVTDKARLTEATSFAGTLRQAQEMYYTEHGSYVVIDSGTTTLASPGLGDYIDSGVPDGWELQSTVTSGNYEITISGTGDHTNLSVTATSGGISTSQ